jgi:thioredoxin reductase
MRALSQVIVPVRPPVNWECDGAAATGFAGESLAASLTAIGKLGLRQGPHGRPRGLFCGMGICGDCLVNVDGRRNVRACMTRLVAGMRVTTCPDPGLPNPISAREPMCLTPDILVIGGGPAGLSAALAARKAKTDVLLLDERESLGGQYFKPLAASHRFRPTSAADRQFREGQALRDAVAAEGVACLAGTVVWHAHESGEVAAMKGNLPIDIRAKRLILATGAFERAVPLPGWTLPGVLTTGAVQTLVRANRVLPGARIVVAGHGPLNWQLAAELKDAGADVAVVAEASRANAPARVSHLARMLVLNPRLGFDGLRLMVRLRLLLSFGTCVTAVHGADRVTGVTLAAIDEAGCRVAGSERHVDADIVALGYGFYPANEIARMLGCRHRPDPLSGSLKAERDADGQTNVRGVYVIGDSAGLGGALAACAEGEIAGLAAADSLGHELGPALRRRWRDQRLQLARHRRFQKALWSLFAAPRLALQLADAHTIICRCEGVRRGDIAARATPGVLIGGLKRQTRAGMGRCQGRYCGPLLAEMLAGSEPVGGEEEFFAPRPPLRPMPLGLIARPLR